MEYLGSDLLFHAQKKIASAKECTITHKERNPITPEVTLQTMLIVILGAKKKK